ncbi:hypothetical protein FIBSPDRAFT_1042618 [Athelia psychrophila]|uniref:F-box domain-containing protein n=1 Tax=Athelia psychrophila TaxID=1759441 RepID=A0A166M947_9AGAM|nr:hypothetical protein FIBSPDRAFT_1042618 [Fibularhizoctonia sp. CBS 109695]
MHQCLATPEIFVIITEMLTADAFAEKKPWVDLVNLATTCHLLSDISLDALWRTQTSLIPLLRTMPSDLWGESRGVMRIQRVIRPTDWSRFEVYARRIHHLDHSSIYPLYVPTAYPNAESLQALACAAPRSWYSLCPQVRSLNCLLMTGGAAFWAMPLFMGEQTSTIKFNLDGMDMQGLCTLQSLHRDYPEIQAVSIQGLGVGDPRAADALSYFFSHCVSLQKVEIFQQLPGSVLENLADAPNLRHLRIRVHETESFAIPESPGFSSLQELLLSGKSLEIMPSLVRTLSSPVEWIHVTTDKCVTEAAQLSSLLDSFQTNLSHTHLTQIEIGTHRQSTASDSVCDEGTIIPLLPFTNLTNITIALPIPFCIGNEAIQEMAAAWPRLQSLELGNGGWRNGSKITLGGLLPLFYLPELIWLSIAVDASAIDCDIETISSNPDAANSKLDSLTLQDSRIVDSASIAALFAGFIPNVRRISSWGDAVLRNTGVSAIEANQHRELWRDVEHLVPIFAKVARREKRNTVPYSQT